jgi:hypothetical protein
MTETTAVETTTFLTAADILAADDIKTETVDVPEWGGKVLVRGLSGTERDAFIASISKVDERTKRPNNANATARFLVLCMVKPDGSRLFGNTTDILALGRKSGAALRRVDEVAERLSGLGQQAEKDAEGNSETTPSDGSTSNEPEQPEFP